MANPHSRGNGTTMNKTSGNDAAGRHFETLRISPASEFVSCIEMNRPDARNALNTQMARDLIAVFETIALNAGNMRCVVLTGAGDRAFCAGGDLKERRGMSDEAWQKQHAVFERLARALVDCPVPVIAAVNGAAFGGGCEIAACCDFIYAAETAMFALTEVMLGIMPGAFAAEDALRWGLVNEIVPLGQLLA